MAIVNIITANCENNQLSQQQISRQWDNLGTMIQFAGYPQPEDDEELIFKLKVWMKESEDAEPRELAPILLDGDQWLVSNFYTQLAQTIKFQLWISNESETFVKHSPIFAGHIGKSLSNNGEEGDIDVIPLFDPYMDYVEEKVNELIVAAGDVQIDASLSTSGAAADAKATGDAFTAVNGRLGDLDTAVTSDPYPAQDTLIDYGKSPAVVSSGVAVHDGQYLSATGVPTNSSGPLWYEFPVSEGDSFDVTGRLGNYTVVLWAGAGAVKAKIYTIAEVGSEITTSGIGTYNSGIKAFKHWNLVIPEYDESTFPYHVDKVGITAASYSTTAGSNNTPVCLQNVIKTKLIKSQDVMDDINSVTETACWNNVLNPTEIVTNEYIGTDGVKHSNSTLSHSGYIPVNAGDVVFATVDGISNVRMQYITAYDASKQVVSASGKVSQNAYTVPDDVAYIIISYKNDIYASGDYAINITNCVPYEVYHDKKYPIGVRQNEIGFTTLKVNPFLMFPDYFLELLRYRPMARPTKGYVCLTCDDGRIELATYTIPMCIRKGVPLTMAVMSDSDVFTDANASEYTSTIVDAVNNHGCEIAQHGGVRWTDWPEPYLNAYFDAQDAFFTSIGLKQKSGAVPASYLSHYAQLVAAGRYGVIRSAWTGYDGQGNGGYLSNYYDYYTSGEGSNLFGLSACEIVNGTLQKQKTIIDYAKANNKVVIYYWHDGSLTASDKTMMESVIDYALEQGLEFVTLSQLADLNRGTVFDV